MIPEHCGNFICPKGKDALNCAVNLFHATVERYASDKPVTLLDGILKAAHTFSDFVSRKTSTLGVYVMTKESSNAPGGAVSRSLLFVIKIHLAATQNFGL